jgi:hypothetical protein
VNSRDNSSGKPVYTTAISKGAGCIEETRKLLASWEPGTDLQAFLKRVQQEDLVGARTAYRTKDVVMRVFKPRFLTPTDRPARILKAVLQRGLKRQTFNEMLFLFACRSDSLIYDFTVREYWPAARRAKTVLTVQEGIPSFRTVTEGILRSGWFQTRTLSTSSIPTLYSGFFSETLISSGKITCFPGNRLRI